MEARKVITLKIKEALDACGKTRKLVSEETDIKYMTLQSWIAGKRVPRPEQLKVLAEYLKLPLSYFYGDNIEEEAPADNRITENQSKISKPLKVWKTEEPLIMQQGPRIDLLWGLLHGICIYRDYTFNNAEKMEILRFVDGLWNKAMFTEDSEKEKDVK